MSDIEEIEIQDELTSLKNRADMLGVGYHPSIGLDKLREKVTAAMERQLVDPAPVKQEAETENEQRFRLKQEATKLVRIRVTCMNPAKSEWEGEVFTVGNSVIGTVKRYVPFNNDEGWHVPNIMYQMMKDRQCQIFFAKKTKLGGTVREGKLIKEFAIEVLPPLNEEELKDLAQRQAMSNSVDN